MDENDEIYILNLRHTNIYVSHFWGNIGNVTCMGTFKKSVENFYEMTQTCLPKQIISIVSRAHYIHFLTQ